MGEREASLTHVSIRDAELGWRHITVEEASDLFPQQTVSASDRVFMCELCGQYVPFANPSRGKRYFMHSRGEENKNCKERVLLAPGDRDHILSGVFNQFLSANPRASRNKQKECQQPSTHRLVILSLLPAQL